MTTTQTNFQTLLAEMKVRISALKEKGITGWPAVIQAVDDHKREFNALKTEQTLTRVELAWRDCTTETKRNLLVLAREQVPNITFDFKQPFAEFSQDERAAIGRALAAFSKGRDEFPRNLTSQEFHPKGARRW